MGNFERVSGYGAEDEPVLAERAFDLAMRLISEDGAPLANACESVTFNYVMENYLEQVHVFVAVASGDGAARSVIEAHHEFHRLAAELAGGTREEATDTSWRRVP